MARADIGLTVHVAVTVQDSGRASATDKQLRRLRREVAEIKGMIMTESAEIAEVGALVVAFTEDVKTKIEKLLDLAENPDDETNLSVEAKRELDSIKNVLTAARDAAGVGDENGDGQPVAPSEPAPGDDSDSGAAAPVESGEPASGTDVEPLA